VSIATDSPATDSPATDSPATDSTTAGEPLAPGGAAGRGTDGDAADELAQAFKRALAALRRLRARENQCPGELTYAQYSLLFCLRDQSELSLRELADLAELSPASATEMLDGLAAAGLVHRVRSARDRRVVLTSLTDSGRALVEGHRARVEPRLRGALSRFSDQELLTAAAVLDRLRDMFYDLANDRGVADRELRHDHDRADQQPEWDS
jgi:DNA-binding MarR family transcriptional regulator